MFIQKKILIQQIYNVAICKWIKILHAVAICKMSSIVVFATHVKKNKKSYFIVCLVQMELIRHSETKYQNVSEIDGGIFFARLNRR